MDINIFEPYYNRLQLKGAPYAAAWCNQTVLNAQRFYTLITGGSMTYEWMREHLEDAGVLQSIVWGALLAADPSWTVSAFADAVSVDDLIQNAQAISDGLIKYAEVVTTVEFGELDESYPETRQDVAVKGELDFSWWFAALRRAGYSMTEIYRMRFIGMQYAISLYNGLEVYSQRDVLEEMGGGNV